MKLAFDIELMRPGCVLLQAGMGCDPQLAHEFPASTWLLAPTPNLEVYETSETQLRQLVTMVKEQGS